MPPRPADVPELAWTIRILNSEQSPDAPKLARSHTEDADAIVRAQALMTLAEMGSDQDAEAFLAHTDDEDLLARRRAYDGVLMFASQRAEAVRAAAVGLTAKDGWILERALLILTAQSPCTRASDDPVAKAIVSMLTEIEPSVAPAVFDVLLLRGSATGAITVGLRNGVSKPIMLAALNAAGTSKEQTAVARLKVLAIGRDPLIAARSVKVIGDIDGVRSLDWMIDRLETEKDVSIRDEIAIALRKSTGKMIGFDVPAWRRHAATLVAASAPKRKK